MSPGGITAAAIHSDEVQMMNKPILTGIAALALMAGGVAFAQSAPPPGAMQNRGQWQGRYHQDRLETLKAQLKLTAAQEPAWNEFTKALESMRAKRGAMRGQARSGQLMPAPEYFRERAQWAEAHARRAQELARVVKAFYEKLTPVQRAVFDTHLADSRHSFMRHRYYKRMDRWGPRNGVPPQAPQPASGEGR